MVGLSRSFFKLFSEYMLKTTSPNIANKIKKIRAAVCYNSKSTRLSRMHNNANIMALGSRLTKKSTALKLVNIFLSTKFEGGRHLRRVKKI